MSKRLITSACAAAALLATSPAFAQDNSANMAAPADPASTADPLGANAADPLAENAADPLAVDPLANDPMATAAADPQATEPMADTDEDGDDGGFPWGVLGLLGLVGLLGMNRRDGGDARADTRRDGA